MLHLKVPQLELHRFQIPTAMSDSQSLNTSLLAVTICSKNEHVFIRDLSDLGLQMIFHTQWASLNVALKGSIASNNSTHVPLWQFYLHCKMEETGSPGIICIVCHQVLRQQSEHGTNTMPTHLLGKGHNAKSNELSESEDSELPTTTIDEGALAKLKRPGSWGITIVSSQRKFVFDSLILSILIQLTDRMLQTGSKGLPNCRISPRHLESVPHARIYFHS